MRISIVDGDNKAYSFLHSTQFKAPLLPGIVSIVRRICDKYKPDVMIIAWEGMFTFREKIFPEYKQHRSGMPDDAYEECVRSREVLKALGIPQATSHGYEADDVIATLAAKLSECPDCTICIHSDDKDLYQCLTSDKVMMESRFSSISKKYEDGIVTATRLTEQLGFDSSYFTAYQWLVGDKGDGIPGIRGVGPKGAIQLINEEPLFKDIYANGAPDWWRIGTIDDKYNKVIDKIKSDMDYARDMWKMVKLVTDVEISFDYKLFDNLHEIIDHDKLTLYKRQFSTYLKGAAQHIGVVEEFLA